MLDTTDKNFYEILGLERNASPDEIKEAYREIARVLHPDSNFYSEIVDYEVSNNQLDLFKAVTAAYHTLASKEKRDAYDRTLPPELTGWEDDEVDEDELIEAKLVELGLKEGTPKPKKAPIQKSRASAFGTFGTAAPTADQPSEASPEERIKKKKPPTNPSVDRTSMGMGLRRAAVLNSEFARESKAEATAERAPQSAAAAHSPQRPQATNKAAQVAERTATPMWLYGMIGMSSFGTGLALVLFVIM